MIANPDLRTMAMSDIVTAAWSMRDKFDLTGIGYGRISWGNKQDVITDPFPYYFFLAGMVRLTAAIRIVEVGTHQGGSAKAMAVGLGGRPGKIVTFDVKDSGLKTIGEHAVVKPFQCDANGEEAYRVCLREFGDNKIDFAYIDTAHKFWPTLQSFILYGEILAADFIVLDDITLNEEMNEFFALIRRRYGEDNTIDASVLYPQIRMAGEPRPGFGVVRLHRR
jgi:hypothetical protein